MDKQLTKTKTSYYVQKINKNIGQFWIQKDKSNSTVVRFKYTMGELEILSTFSFKSPYFPFSIEKEKFREALPGEVKDIKKQLKLYIEQVFE